MDERELAKTRESMARLDTDKENLQGEVAILRNQLSAFATELSNKRINVSNMNKILSDKMERLEAAKKKYNATKDRLGKEENAQDNLESANKQADGEFNEAQTM
jgi:chromosome segregation ATPase